MKAQEILIIESRSDKDIYDGRGEGETLKRVLKLQGVNARSIEITNEKMLIKALKIAQREKIKYVHISAHGLDKGFILTDNVIITWQDLDQLAWPLLKGKCLCFSSCSVGKGVGELFYLHKTFCNVIVAPTRDISWGEGLVAYSAFYHRVQAQENSYSNNVKIMNHVVGAGTFRFITSATCSYT